ncbi:MAG: hypothetical protein IKU84_07050 [Clostridia bacterium]|nr:hypothetical protein [Clostridia bacterium]
MTREGKRVVAASIMLVLMIAYGICTVFFSRFHFEEYRVPLAIAAGFKFLPFVAFFILVLLQKCGKNISNMAVVVTTIASLLVTGVIVDSLGFSYFEGLTWAYDTTESYALLINSAATSGIILLAVVPFVPWCAKFAAVPAVFYTSLIAIFNLALVISLKYTSVEIKDVCEMFAYAFLANSIFSITWFSPEFKLDLYDEEDDEE